jgi:predicted transcriptional regulator
MSIARKILDLHGQDTTELAKELQALPHGRYKLVPEDEAGEELWNVSSEDIAAINEGFDQADRDELVDLDEVMAGVDRRIAAAEATQSR